ncbi:hypothetical protein SYNPS1DRAFT_28410 [Syncephalis pseudoplumigaleata]|uniref:Zn(2)-C6 fungal-type domain-containing protein n=1 Tax=Syncephalis pseudoplumigaleata TaxID=1712513 RepID=A0A4P9Z0F4_9FUNG|nr:hypothetical protein SYNPS1DRAFT_28410 [Syncephalis pseudoplumigaleata]|eukprot:RKP25864.1 hypothetical protein SYNPS1DRAFT_28410 [Syncephalis pseudoplumigaleata]
MTMTRRKRMQVKCACDEAAAAAAAAAYNSSSVLSLDASIEPCHRACKKCDDARPCSRCVRYGYEAACVDHTRKARQPGVKRGPYRRSPELMAPGAAADRDGVAGHSRPPQPSGRRGRHGAGGTQQPALLHEPYSTAKRPGHHRSLRDASMFSMPTAATAATLLHESTMPVYLQTPATLLCPFESTPSATASDEEDTDPMASTATASDTSSRSYSPSCSPSPLLLLRDEGGPAYPSYASAGHMPLPTSAQVTIAAIDDGRWYDHMDAFYTPPPPPSLPASSKPCAPTQPAAYTLDALAVIATSRLTSGAPAPGTETGIGRMAGMKPATIEPSGAAPAMAQHAYRGSGGAHPLTPEGSPPSALFRAFPSPMPGATATAPPSTFVYHGLHEPLPEKLPSIHRLNLPRTDQAFLASQWGTANRAVLPSPRLPFSEDRGGPASAQPRIMVCSGYEPAIAVDDDKHHYHHHQQQQQQQQQHPMRSFEILASVCTHILEHGS